MGCGRWWFRLYTGPVTTCLAVFTLCYYDYDWGKLFCKVEHKVSRQQVLNLSHYPSSHLSHTVSHSSVPFLIFSISYPPSLTLPHHPSPSSTLTLLHPHPPLSPSSSLTLLPLTLLPLTLLPLPPPPSSSSTLTLPHPPPPSSFATLLHPHSPL